MIAINSRFEKLSDFVETACNFPDGDVTGIQMRRFSSVLICGFIERSVEIVVLERLKNRAQPQVLKFIKSHFKRGTNYTCEAICQLLIRFDASWRENFDAFIIENDDVVQGVKSVYEVRNSIAHGGDAGITPATLRLRRDNAKLLIDALIVATR